MLDVIIFIKENGRKMLCEYSNRRKLSYLTLASIPKKWLMFIYNIRINIMEYFIYEDTTKQK